MYSKLLCLISFPTVTSNFLKNIAKTKYTYTRSKQNKI